MFTFAVLSISFFRIVFFFFFLCQYLIEFNRIESYILLSFGRLLRILRYYWGCLQTHSTHLTSLPLKKTFQAKPKFFSIPVQETQTQSMGGLNLFMTYPPSPSRTFEKQMVARSYARADGRHVPSKTSSRT